MATVTSSLYESYLERQLLAEEFNSQLESLVNWEKFALHLDGISQEDVDSIKKDYPLEVSDQRLALIHKWLSACVNPTWDRMVLALEKADESEIVQKMLSVFPVVDVEKNDAFRTLTSLQISFAQVSARCKEALRKKIESNEIQLSNLIKSATTVNHSINPAEATNIDSFFAVISPHYHFLNCQLLEAIAEEGLKNDDLKKSSNGHKEILFHQQAVQKFKKEVRIKNLYNTLDTFCQKSPAEIPITLQLHYIWENIDLHLLELLLQNIFDLDENNIPRIFRVIPGPLTVVFLMPRSLSESLAAYSAKEETLQFMLLTGVTLLQIGEVCIYHEEMLVYTFETGLSNARTIENWKAVEFLSTKVKLSITRPWLLPEADSTTRPQLLPVIETRRQNTERIARVSIDYMKNAATDNATPLLVACQEGNMELAKELLEKGDSPNFARADGVTPLIVTSFRGDAELVRLLLHHGADHKLKAADGHSPLTVAMKYGHTEVIKFLIKKVFNLLHE